MRGAAAGMVWGKEAGAWAWGWEEGVAVAGAACTQTRVALG